MPMDIYYFADQSARENPKQIINVENDDLLDYESNCVMCDSRPIKRTTVCCNEGLCYECHSVFIKEKYCQYCHQRVLKHRIKNFCTSLFNKNILYGILIFLAWYIINFVVLYICQYYVYHIKVDAGMFILLLLVSLNSSLAIIIIALTVISCSFSLTTKLIDHLNGNRSTDGYLSYDEL